MSNEMKDWIAENKKDASWWITNYPFLAIKDNSIYPWLTLNSTEEHWLSDLPDGWVNSFGVQMCDELLDALGKYVDDFIIIQTKEKYGSLRMYWRWNNREHTKDEVEDLKKLYKIINDIIYKYDEISYNTCVKCGATATCYTSPWILPYCKDCLEHLQTHR